MKKILILIIIFAMFFGMIGCSCSKIDEDFDNLAKWQNEYRLAHPDATDEEVDQAFNDAMQGLENWTAAYKLEHPDATDEEVDQAFKDAWGE